MKVFISWSEEPSRSIALALSDWLQNVTQHVDPWMSETDIEGGARWNDHVAKALNNTDLGIVCVTAANRDKPWLMFEAGALAKHLDSARVVPLLIDLSRTQITGPLAAFQSVELHKEGMRKLVGCLMTFRDKPPSKQSTDQLFERLWPDFEDLVAEAKQRRPSETVHRSTGDMLEEIIDRVRRIEYGHTPPRHIAPQSWLHIPGQQDKGISDVAFRFDLRPVDPSDLWDLSHETVNKWLKDILIENKEDGLPEITLLVPQMGYRRRLSIEPKEDSGRDGEKSSELGSA